MPLLAEAISRYHGLLDSGGYLRNLDWAELLHERMRQRHLVNSGRVISPILRPEFITRPQLERLCSVAGRLSAILEQIETWASENSHLGRRMQLIPAEKMLAALPCGYARSGVATRMDAGIQNGSLRMHGAESCKPAGFAYGEMLADLFLALPVMKEFQASGYRVSKLGDRRTLWTAIRETWRQFGGGTGSPQVGIVELNSPIGQGVTEGALLVEILRGCGAKALLVRAEELDFREGKLCAGDFRIDVVLRRFLTRELIARFELSHPLLRAYDAGAVCVVNGFRSEMGRRRAIFELLTDDAVLEKLSAADQELVGAHVPWTRIVSARKTSFRGTEVDLLPLLQRNRSQFLLLPNDPAVEEPVYVGAKLSAAAWGEGLQAALRTPYVVQETSACEPRVFPVLQYGEVQLKRATVSVHPNICGGVLQGASASLESWDDGFARPLAVAPVLVLDRN